MLADQFPLRRRLQNLRKQQSIKPDQLSALEANITASIERCALRQQHIPKPTFEADLPVIERRHEIAQAIKDNQVIILSGETGSGKTTQLPKICLELGRGVSGLIGHTQPRRIAARTVATRIAEELNSELGDIVGYKVRFHDQVKADRSYIKLMTDGILLAETQNDKFLNQYDTIIIDEAHERSLNIDFILGYLKQLLPRRPELKLIITSATIDPQRFSQHFDDAPIIQVSGRTYPVDIRYRGVDEQADKEQDQSQAIIAAVDELNKEKPGDILVFLSGEREIRDTADALNKLQLRHTEVMPLYARLSNTEQNRIFQSHSGRRIVLATNVAETSLTVPGIKYVIDPGTARISRYSVRSKVQRLPIESISQASANQRSGRCGRVSEGICIRLYSEEDFLNRDEFTDPEILRTNLASVILQMLALGLGKIDDFPFVEAPDSRNINDGFRLLEELGAVHRRDGQLSLTPQGKQLARLPIDPRYARMVLEAARLNSLNEVLIIAAGLSIQDPRERPQDKRQAADEKHSEYANKESDFLGLFQLWQFFKEQQKTLSSSQLRKWCKSQYLNFMRMREWQDIVSQLKKAIAELGLGLSTQAADYQAIHQAMAAGLLSHIGSKEKERDYLGARNSRFKIFPGSGLNKAKPQWVMVAELVETSHLFGRMAAKIEPQWVEGIAEHLIKKDYSEPHWSKKNGAVEAFEKITLYGLTLVSQRRKMYSQIDPTMCRDIFIREALVQLNTRLNYAFLKHNQKAVEQVEALEEKTRRRDLLVDEENLVAFYAQHIPGDICTEAGFKKWWQKISIETPELLHFDPDMLFKKQANEVNEYSFPEYWRQGNLTLALQYHFEPKDPDDGVSLLIPLALLNQVHDIDFDWLIPGLRYELIVSLIKSLPKKLRRNFVPAPNYADACLADIAPRDKKGQPVSFLSAISQKLKRMTGLELTPDEWQIENLPAHLRFNFKVMDEKNQLVKQGRNLHELQHGLQGKVEQSLQKVASPELEKSGLTQWDFAALPREFVKKNSGFELKAYPALVAEKQSVAIKLFDKPHQAKACHKQGLRQLMILAIPSPVKYLQDKLPNKAKLGLYFNPFGNVSVLIDDCIAAGVDQLIAVYCAKHNGDIRDKEDFLNCVEWLKGGINEQVLSIAEKVEKGLTQAHSIKKKMKGNVPLSLISAHGDIKQQLDSLVYNGFVSDIGFARLDPWQRYIEGIVRRLEKLPIDPTKDRLHQINIEKVQSLYQAKLQKIPAGMPVPQALQEVRWMLEELRVSFFAQQLGTSMPISGKRIIQHLGSC